MPEHGSLPHGSLPHGSLPGAGADPGTGRGPSVAEVVEIDGDPYGVAVAASGALWFTMPARGAIGRWDGTRQATFPLEPADGSPTVLLADGEHLWFSEFRGGRIGRIEPGGAVTFESADSPYGLCRTPDGALWFTEMNAGAVVRRAPDGSRERYAVEGMPSAVAAGPDGTVWFTLNRANAVGRISPGGALRVYPLPTEGAAPVGITADAGGAWFAEIGAGQLGHLACDGTITEFPLPDRQARPHAVIIGPDGALWFTEWAGARLGRMTPDGRVTEMTLPGA
ncbi:Vgb family protein, partial [Nocardia farcinica]|uniref:Vgb family protein n=1 Tax=Nocardia farcinica TaxID=37329 RepID=UPI002457348E